MSTSSSVSHPAQRSAVTPAETDTEMTYMVMPNDANHLGTAFGGRVMEWVDVCGAISASRLCRRPVVLAALDHMAFWHPIKVGHIAQLQARVNYVGTTSMEVGVKVMSEDPLTGEQRQTSTAYLTYVALDPSGSKINLPELALESANDHRRHAAALLRRQQRLLLRQSLQAVTPATTKGKAVTPATTKGKAVTPAITKGKAVTPAITKGKAVTPSSGSADAPPASPATKTSSPSPKTPGKRVRKAAPPSGRG